MGKGVPQRKNTSKRDESGKKIRSRKIHKNKETKIDAEESRTMFDMLFQNEHRALEKALMSLASISF